MEPGKRSNRKDRFPALYRKEPGGRIRCLLCHHGCSPAEGKAGICGSRQAQSGRIEDRGYGLVTAAAVDPIEKKPLYHFHPGEPVFSLGFTGCNYRCPFCQNWNIADPSRLQGTELSPRDAVTRTLESGCRLLAFTYSEPTIHFEYLCETAALARSRGIKTVLVTNGGLLPDPAGYLLDFIDGVNVDVKSWDADYYRRVLGGDLDTVLGFLEIAAEKTWLEVTTLVVPGDNDNTETVKGISGRISGISPDIPLHLSAYHPAKDYSRRAATAHTMEELGTTARESLRYVYLGNLGQENSTCCPECGTPVIRRTWYETSNILETDRCPECGSRIPGVFE